MMVVFLAFLALLYIASGGVLDAVKIGFMTDAGERRTEVTIRAVVMAATSLLALFLGYPGFVWVPAAYSAGFAAAYLIARRERRKCIST